MFSDVLPQAEWYKLFEECDFNVVSYQTDPHVWTTSYLLRNKYACRPRKIVNFDDVESFDFVEELKRELNDVYEGGAEHNVWLVNSGVSTDIV